jgi:hypothetical protein
LTLPTHYHYVLLIFHTIIVFLNLRIFHYNRFVARSNARTWPQLYKFFNRTIFWYMLCSVFRGKSTKKRQRQGDDDKIEEMDMVSIKWRWGNGSTTRTWWNSEAKDWVNPLELGWMKTQEAPLNTWWCWKRTMTDFIRQHQVAWLLWILTQRTMASRW